MAESPQKHQPIALRPPPPQLPFVMNTGSCDAVSPKGVNEALTTAMSIAATRTSSSFSSTAHNLRPATVAAIAAAVTPTNTTQIKKRTKAINDYRSIVDSYRTVPQAIRNKEKCAALDDVTTDGCVQRPAGDQCEKYFSNNANHEFIEHLQQTAPIMAAAAAAALAWARSSKRKASSDNVTLTELKEAHHVPPSEAEATVDAPVGAQSKVPLLMSLPKLSSLYGTVVGYRNRNLPRASNVSRRRPARWRWIWHQNCLLRQKSLLDRACRTNEWLPSAASILCPKLSRTEK